MKNLILIGQTKSSLAKAEACLGAQFSVGTALFGDPDVTDKIEAFTPDVIVIVLNGARESDKLLFRRVSVQFGKVPIVTIGSETEKAMFAQYYKDRHFENIPDTADDDTLITAVEKRTGETDGFERYRPLVLVVDDDMSLLRSVKAILEDEYNVSIAVSGPSAMKIMMKKHPELVLLDYEMPECDGKQTLEMIRTNENTKDIPVMFLTSMSDREHIESIMGLDPFGYLVKPVEPDKLKESVERVIYLL